MSIAITLGSTVFFPSFFLFLYILVTAVNPFLFYFVYVIAISLVVILPIILFLIRNYKREVKNRKPLYPEECARCFEINDVDAQYCVCCGVLISLGEERKIQHFSSEKSS
ncbi:MAG: hypothetical protein ACTSPI_02515 [Candidatus Heimdallarchaeaceae archaeon]